MAWLLATAATGSVLACGPCAAGSDAPAAPSGNSANQNDVDEVIVTANKRSEALMSTAAPVTALQASDLTLQGADKLSDYVANVPGLNLISSGGQTAIILRGISTGYGAVTSATASTYVDDVPYGSATANAYGSIATLDLDPGTLQRVEVLRGPQGTLYGADALGGLIKYVTRLPSLTEYRGRVELDGAAIDNGGQGGGIRAMMDGPLIQNELGITVNAYTRLDPGFINDPYLNEKNVNSARVWGGRVAAFWNPTDQFTAEVTILSQSSFNDGTATADDNFNLTPIYGKYEHVRHGKEQWNAHDMLYSLHTNYDFGWADLTYIASYQHQAALWTYDETIQRGATLSADTGIPNLGVFEHVELNHNKSTQEVRLSSPDNQQFEWLGGFFYTHEFGTKDENYIPINTITNRPVALSQAVFHDILDDRYLEYAGYADVTYHVTPDFKVLTGLRFTSNSETAITPFSGILFGPATVDVGSSADHSLTYLVTPSYTLDDHNMVYLRVASGYRPGGPTGVSPQLLSAGAPESYRPDTLTNYEVGYKASIPSLKMTVDTSIYDLEWKNIQILSQINGFNVTGNGAGARSQGIELASTWKPVAGLDLGATASYTNAYMTGPDAADAVQSGDRLPYVPRWNVNLSANYDFLITSDVGGFVGGNFQYSSSIVRDYVSGVPASYTRPIAPGYNVVNLHAGVNRGDLTIEAYAKNVGDSYGINRIKGEATPLYKAPFAVTVIPPRTFGLSITAEF